MLMVASAVQVTSSSTRNVLRAMTSVMYCSIYAQNKSRAGTKASSSTNSDIGEKVALNRDALTIVRLVGVNAGTGAALGTIGARPVSTLIGAGGIMTVRSVAKSVGAATGVARKIGDTVDTASGPDGLKGLILLP
jgi:hypothetical protein